MKSVLRAVLAVTLCSFSALPVRAAEQSWTAAKLHGTVLFLSNNEWQEVSVGQHFGAGAVVRTLQAGTLVLTQPSRQVTLQPGAALAVSPNDPATLVQYGGDVEVRATGNSGLVLDTPHMAVSIASATVRAVVKNEASVFTIVQGSAKVNDGRRHQTVELTAGDIFNSQLGVPSASQTGPAAPGNGAGANQTAVPSISSNSAAQNGNSKNNGNHNGAGNGKGKDGK